MKIDRTGLEGVLLIKPDVFEDHRGQYIELYNEKIFHDHDIKIKFIQDDISMSHRNVLRGIHGDTHTWKLISCLFGKFYLVVVNCDTASEYFGQWRAFTLSASNRQMVLVPPLYGNAHLVLSETAIFHYKQSTYYNPKGQFTYCWNDPNLNIWWPIKEPILSQRDTVGHFVDPA